MNTFKNRNILITGATSGLGKELSIYLDQKVKSLIKDLHKICQKKNLYL